MPERIIKHFEDVINWHQKRMKENPTEAKEFLRRAGISSDIMSEKDKMKYDIQALKDFMGQVGDFGYDSVGKFYFNGTFTCDQLTRICVLMERYKDL